MSQTSLAEQSRTFTNVENEVVDSELINKWNIQLRVVEDSTTELRDTIAAELLSFYEFLTRMFLPEESLKRVPREGWSFVNAKRFAFLGKTDAVIDLYKHIPYISQDDEAEYPMGPKCVCLDYTGRCFKIQAMAPRAGKPQPPEALDRMKKEDTWQRLSEPQHIAVLAKPASLDGLYILVDMRDGRVASISPKYSYVQEWFNLSQLLTWVKQSFLALSIMPVSSLRVIDQKNTYMSSQDLAQIKALFQKHGWPTANFDKEACLADVGKVYDAFWERSYGGGSFSPSSLAIDGGRELTYPRHPGSTRKRYTPSATKTIARSKGPQKSK